uniref:Hexosyltransferase n=1 Tax=Pyrodinium bahamense TaxID=73915 RepID=A0A7S0ABK1_9DINO|mmetsp:Transcript_30222/g.83385  ORF Transcript_30222/g.83385 Transcript_30222/m.83385 type:complete len:402 (+) Transcript_30222:74-1279(+)
MELRISSYTRLFVALAATTFVALQQSCVSSAGGEDTEAALLQFHLKQHDNPVGGGKKRLRIAIAAYVSQPIPTLAWRDAFAVFAYAAQRVKNQSRHAIDIMAIVPDTFTEHDQQVFAKLGIPARPFPPPVSLQEMNATFAKQVEHSGCCGYSENLKLHGAGMTQYDRVLVLDADVLLLDPMDELFDQTTQGMAGTFDYDLAIEGTAFPTIQGGFFLFVPDKKDYDALKQLVRLGDWRSGTGWHGSGTGYAYGGGLATGLVSFYYNMVDTVYPKVSFRPEPLKYGTDLPGNYSTVPAGSRFQALDRSIYDVLDTEDLRVAWEAKAIDLSHIKAFHFAGDCLKPWDCALAKTDVCRYATDKWWQMRRELKQKLGLDASAGGGDQCSGYGEKAYTPLKHDFALL